MPKFSYFFKNKKILVFLFLFLVIFGLITPRISVAIDWSCVVSPSLCVGNAIYNWFSGDETSVGDKIWNKLKEPLVETGKDLLMAIVGGITFLLIMIFGTLANLAGGLLLWVMAAGQSVSYTHITGPDANLAVQAGWPMVRDLANMFIVLGFVIIGIATALRFREYEAKKLLPKLIIVALLVNFSLVICGLFIDGSNIIMDGFGVKGGYLQRTWTKNVWKQAVSLIDNWNPKAVSDYIGKAVGLVFQDIMMVVIFFLFFFLLIARYIALWILVILSPLAFVCYVFPFTKKFFEMWWSNFFQWCIIGIPAMFFLWLSDTMAGKLSKVVSSPAATSTVSGSFLSMMTYLIPGMFLLIGFLFSLQISAMGTGAAIGAAKWSGKGVGKIGGAVGGALAKKTGLEAAGRKISSATGRTLERLGLRETGTTAAANKKQVEDKAKIMADEYAAAKASGDTSTVNRIQKWARTERGVRGAAAMKVVSEAKDLHEAFRDPTTGRTDLAAAHNRLNYAESVGAKDIRKEAVKIMPALAAQDTPVVQKIQNQHPGWTPQQAQHEAVVRAALKVPEESLDRDFVDSVNYTVIRDAGARMTNRKKEALKRNTLKSVRQQRRATPRGSPLWRELAMKEREIRNL